MTSSIVKVDTRHYRRIAQENWGLTKEQMKGMHVHHRLPQSQGGTNDPSNLYVCSPSFHAHAWHNGKQFILWAQAGSAKGAVLGGSKSKGKRKSEEHKRKIGDGNRGKICPHRGKKCSWKSHARSEKQKELVSKRFKGVPKSAEQRQKISDSHQNRPPMTCPHCGTVGKGGGGSMKRWHFDNCRHKVH